MRGKNRWNDFIPKHRQKGIYQFEDEKDFDDLFELKNEKRFYIIAVVIINYFTVRPILYSEIANSLRCVLVFSEIY